MKELIARKSYNANKRPSDHSISPTSFFRDNGGSIPSNVLRYSNTGSRDDYLTYCRAKKLTPHPARMPIGLPEFFIKFLTDPDDIVLDPFGGSNTTGAAAEKLGRRWITVEAEKGYVQGSRGRFLKHGVSTQPTAAARMAVRKRSTCGSSPAEGSSPRSRVRVRRPSRCIASKPG